MSEGFWFAVLHVMSRLGLFKPYVLMVDRLLNLLCSAEVSRR